MKIAKIISTIAIAFVFFVACSKESGVKNNQNLNTSSVSNAVANACDLFAYSDTIYYLQSTSGDYVINPLNSQSGTYGAFPDGLKINKKTGSINVTESETGLKFIVWFVATGAKDTCKRTMRISGVNYSDSIYVLASNQSSALPIYNADTTLAVPCNGCTFDDGNTLTTQGVSINKKTGVLNLKKTISNGALGTNPKNGAFKDYVLNYRIGDKSGKALNTIGFRLYYYKTKAQVPDSLKNILAVKQGQVLLNDDGPGDDGGGSHGGGGGHGQNKFASVNLSGGTTNKNGQGEVKCRPPYIIVTQN